MHTHLTDVDLNAWLMGEHEASAEAHLRDCKECLQTVKRMEETLAAFSHSMQAWSVAQSRGRAYGAPLEVKFALWRRPRIYGAACILAAALVVEGWRVSPLSQLTGAAIAVSSDVALLSAVDSQLDRSVPAPMQPLTRLVRWGGEPEPSSDAGL